MIPSHHNSSRFFLLNLIELEETWGLVSGMIPTLREQLLEALPHFGVHLGYDGKAIQTIAQGIKTVMPGTPLTQTPTGASTKLSV